MDKIYQVVHEYDADGGFGDAIWQRDVVAVFENEDDAKAFVERFAKPHVYDKPYDYLCCGSLTINEVEILKKGANLDEIDAEDFWWLTNKVLDEPQES